MAPNLPHSTIVESARDGRKFFRLACRDDYLCNFFDDWSFTLAKKKKFHTVKAYANGVKRFINYYLEADEQLKGSVSSLDLFVLLENFESYLAFGSDSDIELIQRIGVAVPPGNIGAATIEQTIAGLNNFLEASESFRVALLQLTEAGYIDGATKVAGSGLIKYLGTVEPQESVKRAVRQSSWFAACINGGMKKIKQAHLKPKSKSSEIIVSDEFGGDHKTFPFDLAKGLINSAPNLRDKLLWSLLAASGIRISEAMSMFESDVVIQTSARKGKLKDQRWVTSKKVFVIDPDSRRSELIPYLSETEINSLPHKGRERPDTFLIEPFASIFWRTLAEYRADENRKARRRPVVPKHPFLFSLVDSGRPITSSYQTLYDSFSNAAERLTGKKYGFHSLRHMYGYYTHNFAYLGDGEFGLPLKEVQLLLGHADIKTTQRYARQDIMKLEVAMGALNMAQASDPFFSIEKAKLEFLEAKIAETRANLKQNKLGNTEND
jgi:integrase/recombinase XerD